MIEEIRILSTVCGRHLTGSTRNTVFNDKQTGVSFA